MSKLFLIFVLMVFSFAFVQSACNLENIETCDPSFFEDESNVARLDDNFLIAASGLDSVENKDLIFHEIDKRISDVNSYPNFFDLFNEGNDQGASFRESWWENHGYKSSSAKLESFDGKIVTTSGKDSTTFNINHFEGGFVTDTGCLKAKGFSSCASNVKKVANNQFSFEGGEVILENDFSGKLSFSKDSSVSLSGVKYSSDNGVLNVQKSKNFILVSGNDVVGTDISSNKVVSVSSGEISLFEDHVQIGKGTSYTDYTNGIESKTLSVFSPANYYSSVQGCSETGSLSCVDFSGGHLRVFGEDNNDLRVFIHDDSVKNLEVARIEDYTSVKFRDKNNFGFDFYQGVPRFSGNPAKFSTNVYSYFLDSEDRTVHEFKMEDGRITQCSFPCLRFGARAFIEPKVEEFVFDGVKQKKSVNDVRQKYDIRESKDDPILRPDYVRYIDYDGDPALYEAAVGASDRIYRSKGVRVSPEFIYISAIAEGGDKFVSKEGASPEKNNIFIDGYQALGFDRAYYNIPILKEEGWLPSDFNDGDEYVSELQLSNGKVYDFTAQNEQNENIRSVGFRNFDDALFAKGAELARRRQIVLQDIGKLGLDLNSFSQDELDFWNYVYYNYGIYGGKEMLSTYSKRGYLANENYVWNNPSPSYPQVHRNARLRMANLKLVEPIFNLE